MNKNRTYTIGLGGVALTAVALALAFPAKSPARLIQAASNADQTTVKTSDQQPEPSVKVNGEPVKLDDQGQAKIKTPSGGTVHVKSKSTPATASGSESDSANQNVNLHVESKNDGTGQSSSTTSTSINISGDSSKSVSNTSSTIDIQSN